MLRGFPITYYEIYLVGQHGSVHFTLIDTLVSSLLAIIFLWIFFFQKGRGVRDLNVRLDHKNYYTAVENTELKLIFSGKWKIDFPAG